jgi:hypothetical protein
MLTININMRKTLAIVLMTAGLWSLLSSCYYDVEENLYGPPAACDSLAAVSFTTHIQPLLSSKCLSCHNNAAQLGGINLEGYNNLNQWLSNGRFEGSVNHSPGFSPMPKGLPKLNNCDLQKINQWLAEGAPNN